MTTDVADAQHPTPVSRRVAPRGVRRGAVLLWLLRLHLRYLRFDTALLSTLPDGGHRPLGQLAPHELAFAARWNHRISRVLSHLNAPYARCMKRALVLAMMLADEHDLDLVIGVRPDDPSDGHAWIERGGEVLLERFTAQSSPYVEIRRLRVAPFEEGR